MKWFFLATLVVVLAVVYSESETGEGVAALVGKRYMVCMIFTGLNLISSDINI